MDGRPCIIFCRNGIYQLTGHMHCTNGDALYTTGSLEHCLTEFRNRNLHDFCDLYIKVDIENDY